MKVLPVLLWKVWKTVLVSQPIAKDIFKLDANPSTNQIGVFKKE